MSDPTPRVPTMTSEPTHELRAYRFALDLTKPQEELCRKHAGAARWAFNHALAAKFAALDARRTAIADLVAGGMDPKTAAAQAPKVPGKPAIQKALNEVKGDDRRGLDGLCPWWHELSTYAFQSAFADVDTAWSNWLGSVTGKRAGKRLGAPKFKSKHKSRDSFRIHHNVAKPSIRPDTGYRRIIVPRFGSLRVHDSTKRLSRALDRGAVIQSVTISRGGHRWYASILTKQPAVPVVASQRQLRAGTVGVNIGVHHLAALSTGEIIDNPGHLRSGQKRLTKAQRALSRTEKGSQRRRRAAAKVGRRHHEIAERRASTLHQLTKRLATEFAVVAVEDLNVAGMTRSAAGTIDNPGKNVVQKSGLNRALLDVAPGELRRQVAYKTRWYGSTLAVCGRWVPTSQLCSACGVRAKLTLADRIFRCAACGLTLDRDTNAAVNIAALAVAVAPGTEETRNARRAAADPPPLVGTESVAALKREGHASGVVTPAEQSAGHPKHADPAEYPLVS